MTGVAVVTGAGSGLGRCTAGALVERGWTVVALDVNRAAAEETAAQLGGVDVVEADVTDAAAVGAARDEVLARHGRVDGLVNNAGILPKTPLLEETPEAWRRTLEVNLTGYFLCLQAFGGAMADAGGGAIVNIASIGGTRPTVGAGAYCVSKAGVLALTRQAALELGGAGIRVNAVSPGFMKTAMTSDRYAVSGLEERRAAMIPLGRIAPVEEIASVVAFLLGDESSYVTGEEVIVDGGFVQTTTMSVPQPGAG